VTVVVPGFTTQQAPQVNSAARPSVAAFEVYSQPQEAEIVLGSLQHGAFRLRRSIALRVEVASSTAVRLNWDQVNLSVTAKTTGDALMSIRSEIIKLAISGSPSVADFVESI
jgi:hypothetical protein